MSWVNPVEVAISVLFVLVCWTLAHQNTLGREPFARTISAGYGLSGLATLGALLFRPLPDFDHLVPIAELVSRLSMTLTLALVAARLGRIYPNG